MDEEVLQDEPHRKVVRVGGTVRGLAAAGRQPQARWVTDGFLGEVERKRAWSQADRHLFG